MHVFEKRLGPALARTSHVWQSYLMVDPESNRLSSHLIYQILLLYLVVHQNFQDFASRGLARFLSSTSNSLYKQAEVRL